MSFEAEAKAAARRTKLLDAREGSTGGNGDGIDIDSCKHVVIDGCDISSGDDCIAIKSGRGSEAHALARTTQPLHSRCRRVVTKEALTQELAELLQRGLAA